MSGLVFGINQGIASCGWAVLRRPLPGDPNGEIVAMGSWMFDVPETDKDHTPTNQIRRGNRLLRRVIRRRAQRMAAVRRLFAHHRLLAGEAADALRWPGLDPWELRARGLDKLLSPTEFAVALGHIAKRRGYKSAKTGKEANSASDEQKMLKALEVTRERLGRYRTVGELFCRDPDFRTRKRDRCGLFDRTQSRADLLHEVGELFTAQRRLGNDKATGELQTAFTSIAFRQLPMQDSERLVGMCPFEPPEKRAAKFAPSFEKLRLLAKLVHLRITTPNGERALTPEEIAVVAANLGATAKLTVKAVRKRIGLPDDQRFTAFRPEDESQDIVAWSGEAMHGTRKLRDALGEARWAVLQKQPEQLDRIAHVISFFGTAETIGSELRKLNLPDGTVDAVLADLGRFSRFKGAGHISALAARSLIPQLERGLRYAQACEALGYDHAGFGLSSRAQVRDKQAFRRLAEDMGKEIANPVARKSLTEGLRQLWAMRNRWGLPDAIHIEMARDVCTSLATRNAIKRGIDKNAAACERQRAQVRELLNIADVNGDTLLRYRLWKEQAGRCPYTDTVIPATALIASDGSHQVDYILPWSRFGDDSYSNKVLCTAEVSQQKKGQTPFEWIKAAQGEDGWASFVLRVEGNPAYRGAKKRNYVLESSKEVEEQFRQRNFNDTRYACRLLAEAVRLFYPEDARQDKDGIPRVLTRPGRLTAALRHAWGVESLKKIDGKRIEDGRHHALDALVVAGVGEWEVQRLTRAFREWEQQGLARSLRQVEPPWGDAASFRRTVQEACDAVLVARPERRRARGEGHAATVRQVKQRDGVPAVYERKSITDLSEQRLVDIKDPERNQGLIAAIRQWIADGRPADRLPRSPAGDEIRKVRLRTKGKPAVPVRGGTADRGEIVRVDVFVKPKRSGREEFHLVPIYPHHVMNKRDWPLPPMRAVVAAKDEEEWTLIDDRFTFRFSLYPRTFVEVMKSTGEVFDGYFAGMDRSTGSIRLLSHNDTKNVLRGLGSKRLLNIRKFNVDRFGGRFEVTSEVRTWHGLVLSPVVL